MRQLMRSRKWMVVICTVWIGLAGCSSSSTETLAGASEMVNPSITPMQTSSQETEIKTIQIRDHLLECVSIFVTGCLQSRESSEADWGQGYYSGEIEGFEFEWGYLYELEISVSPVENPPADGSSIRYTLLNTLSKTPVQEDTVFEYYSIFTEETLTKKSDDTYSLFSYDEKDFTCVPSDCQMIDSLLEQKRAILFEFKHAADLSAPLILKKIVCNASVESFRQQCLEVQPTQTLSIDFTLLDTFNQVSNSFVQGETIKFVFNIENSGTENINLNFTSGQYFDITIRAVDNTEVWRWSDDKVFTQALDTLTADAMSRIQKTADWDQSLADGSVLEIGEYTAYGNLLNHGGPIEYTFSIQ